MADLFADQHQVQFKTQQPTDGQYQIYMRDLERNIIYCHQKLKRNKTKTVSQTKSIPLQYKSIPQTAIDFEQVGTPLKNSHIQKQNNGNYINNSIQSARAVQNAKLSKMKGTKITKELDSKLQIMKKCISAKKTQKRFKKDEGKKENKFYRKMLEEQEMQAQRYFGLVKPLRKAKGFGFQMGFMGVQNRTGSKCMKTVKG